MEISWQQVLATIINFVILLIILKFAFWNKIKEGIEARQKSIVDKVQATNQNLKESEELKIKNKEILKTAHLEAKKVSEAKKQQAMRMYEDIVNDAKVKANGIKEKADEDIQRESLKMRHQLKQEAVGIAVDLSKKAVGEIIDEEKHKQIIDKFIEQVGI